LPTLKEHYKKSGYNEKFFDDVKHEYPDWAITGLFYAALHLMEAFLAVKDIHVEDHKERVNYIGRLSELKPLYQYYRALYDYSVNARYKMHSFTPESINKSYEDFFIPIKDSITKQLKKAGHLK
jgi:hypothetical protein